MKPYKMYAARFVRGTYRVALALVTLVLALTPLMVGQGVGPVLAKSSLEPSGGLSQGYAQAPSTITNSGRIIYLATDGVTIKSIKPNGSDVRTLYRVSK